MSSGGGQPVATNGVVPADGAGQSGGPNQQTQQSGWQIAKGFLFRMFIMYLLVNFFRRPSTPTTGDPASGPAGSTQLPCTNLYKEDTKMDIYFYLSESKTLPDFDNKDNLIGSLNGLVYGDWTAGPNKDSSFILKKSFTTSQSLMNNNSIYLHVYMLPYMRKPWQRESTPEVIHKVHQLNKYKKRKFINTVNLLTGKTDVHPDLVQKENSSKDEVLSHWHPNITINYVVDQTQWVEGAIPQPLNEYIQFVPGKLLYYPPIYVNDYWNLQSEYMPINETTPELNLTITVHPLSLLKWQFYAAQGMRKNWYSSLLEGGAEQSDNEQDTLKQTLLDTNPYLLALTITVSLVHSVFEFLAFKNDIQFWKNRQSLEGLSVRSVFFQVFQSLVVLMYILDNETNFIVIISVTVGLFIDLWKITKVVNIKVDYENKLFDVFPRITYEDKSTYVQSKTREYDQMAFRYLSRVLFPLLIGYGIYSLIYNEHKSWYSWVLGMLYGFLLMFGFITMTPQLFINYKLKSVAHLPWRMMTYKALNTFIDDLFAFIIKMPTLYRLGCFRDDIVFLIFLYQRWIYKVDPTRVNEFGTSGDSPSAVTGEDHPSPPIEQKPEEAKKQD